MQNFKTKMTMRKCGKYKCQVDIKVWKRIIQEGMMTGVKEFQIFVLFGERAEVLIHIRPC